MFLFQDHVYRGAIFEQVGYFQHFLDTHDIPQIKIQELQLHYMHLVNKKPFVRGLHKLF